MKIIIDTNFATIPFDFHVDIYAEFSRIIDEPVELIFPKMCLAELKELKYGHAALELMEERGVKIVEIPRKKSVDDSIVAYAKEIHASVATQDAELKKKVLKNTLPIITLREKQYLIKRGGI